MMLNSDKQNTTTTGQRSMVSVKGLSVRYDKVEVLKGIDIEVRQGEVVSLIGANGAGKTTLVMAISGLAPISEGQVWFEDTDLRTLKPHQIAGMGMAHVPQGRRIVPDLTVKGNLELGAYRFRRRDRNKVLQLMEREFERFPILGERRNQIASSLSGGEQQMLAISRSLMMDPKCIMMDEPSIGLAPLVVEQIMKAIWHLHKTGITILLVEQAATLALALSHRGYVLQNGEIFMKGTARELQNTPEIVKGYIGG